VRQGHHTKKLNESFDSIRKLMRQSELLITLSRSFAVGLLSSVSFLR
jgi:hypothetical protein